MNFTEFAALVDWIAARTGLDEERAARLAVIVGDTPETLDNGEWTATMDGETYTFPGPP